MVYQDGVNAIIALGAGYAASMFQWSITEIGLFGMITNVMAIFSCLVASRMDTRFGSKVIVMISLWLLLLASVGIVSTGRDYLMFGIMPLEYLPAQGLFATPAEHAFLVYGVMLGAAFGPVQASSGRGLPGASGLKNQAAISVSMPWQGGQRALSAPSSWQQ